MCRKQRKKTKQLCKCWEFFLLVPLLAMGGSGLQWSFSGKPGNPPQILSFKAASEGGSHSIYPPGLVQKVVSAEKNAASSLVSRQTQNYGALVGSGHAKTGQLVASPLISPSAVVSNSQNGGVGCRANPESLGSLGYKVPASSVPRVSSAVVGSTNLSSGESSYDGPSQMTIFYNGLVCVYDDVAPEKAQAIMLLAGNGNSRSQKPAQPTSKAQPHAVLNPPAAIEVTTVNSLPILPKPVQLEPLPTDLSGSSSSKVSETSSGPSKAATATPPNDSATAGTCAGTVEVNQRNPASMFPALAAAPNHIRHSQSAMPVDRVSTGASTSTIEVNQRNPASMFPAPAAASNHIRHSQSAMPVDRVSTGGSTSTIEVNQRNPASMFPAPAAALNHIRLSQPAMPVDRVSTGASTSTVEVHPRIPAMKYSSPATGSPGSSRFRFSQSAIPIDPVLAGASVSILESPKQQAPKFPAIGSGPNQICFSQSVSARTSTGRIEISLNNPPPSNQIRFAQSALPIDPVSSAAASTATIETMPKNPAANFPLPAAVSAGPNQIRFSRSAIPIELGSAGAPISIVESNPIKPAATNSGANQFRFPRSAAAIDSASAGASNSIVESNPITSAAKFPVPAVGTGSSQFRFSQSYMDRSVCGSSPSELIKHNNNNCGAPPIDQASGDASVESSAPKFPTAAKGAGEANQLRFSQSGVPLARKASIARFLEKKRKERPSGDMRALGDIPPSKFRANSR